LNNVGATPHPLYGPTVPHSIYMVFQMTFAIITAAIISGAIVERMKMSRYILFLFVWTTCVYDVIAHWVWSTWTEIDQNGNVIQNYGWLRGLGVLDFAGGTVVHITSGMSALVASLIVGKRRVWNKETGQIVTPHNVPMLLTGASMIWFGWFGFNGGSAVASNPVAATAFANTQIAALSSFFTWALLETFYNKLESFTATGAASGAIVGLVVITPASGFIKPIMAVPFGAIGAAACFGALQIKRRIFIVDDTLDVFTCHGVGGFVGATMVGFFATTEVNPAGSNGVFYGSWSLLGYQLVAVTATTVLSLSFTAVILLSMKYTLGLRSEDIESEIVGMDKLSHNEAGYNFESLHAIQQRQGSSQ